MAVQYIMFYYLYLNEYWPFCKDKCIIPIYDVVFIESEWYLLKILILITVAY